MDMSFVDFCSKFIFFSNLQIFVCGGPNMWLETIITEYGMPMKLDCPITNQTQSLEWWHAKVSMEPRKIPNVSNGFLLELPLANHNSSGIYECFDSYNGGFHKFSRKVLVVESKCTKLEELNVTIEKMMKCEFKHMNLNLAHDVGLICNGQNVEIYKTKDILNERMIMITEFYHYPLNDVKCSVGFEKSNFGWKEETTMKQIQEMMIMMTTNHVPINKTVNGSGSLTVDNFNRNMTANKFGTIIFTIISVGGLIFLFVAVMAILFVCRFKGVKFKIMENKNNRLSKQLNLKEDDDDDDDTAKYEALRVKGSNARITKNTELAEQMYITPPCNVNNINNINNESIYNTVNIYEEIREPTYLPLPK